MNLKVIGINVILSDDGGAGYAVVSHSYLSGRRSRQMLKKAIRFSDRDIYLLLIEFGLLLKCPDCPNEK